MQASNQEKIDLGLFKLTLKKPTKQLGEIDESKINDKYFIVVPEIKKLDKRLLLSEAKLEEIDGVELVDSKRALLIK